MRSTHARTCARPRCPTNHAYQRRLTLRSLGRAGSSRSAVQPRRRAMLARIAKRDRAHASARTKAACMRRIGSACRRQRGGRAAGWCGVGADTGSVRGERIPRDLWGNGQFKADGTCDLPSAGVSLERVMEWRCLGRSAGGTIRGREGAQNGGRVKGESTGGEMEGSRNESRR